MPTHLLDYATNYAVETTVAADLLMFGDASDGNAPKMTTIANLVGMQAANMSVATIAGLTATNVQAAIAEHQSSIAGLAALTGTYVGASATVAGFPTTDREGNAVGNGDFAILSADDGGNQAGFWAYNGTAWQLAAEIPDVVQMVAATAGAAGTGGMVPAPAAGQQNFVLAGDATYKDVSTLVPVMGGATALAAGTAGLTPASAAGDESKYLRADGTWQAVSIATEALQATLAEGNTSTLDIDFTTATVGTIYTAPNAGRWRVTVNNAGALVTTSI